MFSFLSTAKWMLAKDRDYEGRWGNRLTVTGLTVVLALVAAACGGDDTSDSSEPSSPRAVVEEFMDLRSDGRLVEGLDLATDLVADRERDFFEGLEAWNLMGEVTEPCEEIVTTRLRCVMLEDDEFHSAGGFILETAMTFTVDEAVQISNIDFNVTGWNTEIWPFHVQFFSWLGQAHPDEAARMGGPPSGGSFNAEEAKIALEYVDEFVAQSDEYPVNP